MLWALAFMLVMSVVCIAVGLGIYAGGETDAEYANRWLGAWVPAAGVFLGGGLCAIATGVWMVNSERREKDQVLLMPSRAGVITSRSRLLLAAFVAVSAGIGLLIVVSSAAVLMKSMGG